MSITHDGFDFIGSNGLHGPLQKSSPEAPIQVGSPPGVKGEAHLLDKIKGRWLACEITLYNRSTQAVMHDAINIIQDQIHELTGTMTFNNIAYPKCTFLGAELKSEFLDGATSTWVVILMLRWRQRIVTSSSSVIDPP